MVIYDWVVIPSLPMIVTLEGLRKQVCRQATEPAQRRGAVELLKIVIRSKHLKWKLVGGIDLIKSILAVDTGAEVTYSVEYFNENMFAL